MDGLELVEQERMAIVPASLLHLFARALESYQLVFVLSPDGSPQPPGRWRAVKCRQVQLERELVLTPRAELADYEELARVMSSYVSSRRTSFVTAVAGIRDGSLALAYRTLEFVRKLRAAPHVLLVLSLDHGDLRDFDKANIAAMVGSLLPYRRYTILPFSIDRVVESSRRAQVEEYVRECLSDLIGGLHSSPVTGTYVPLCFRLEPLSLFRDVRRALNLVFYVFTGLLELPVEKLSGTIHVWRGMRERTRELEEELEGRARITYVDSDALEVRALVELSLRDIVVEGLNIIAKTASAEEAVKVLASSALLSTARV